MMTDQSTISRRRMLRQSVVAAASIGCAGRGAVAHVGQPGHPLRPSEPHFPARAQRVIFLYMTGGVPHVDSFDPKPALNRRHGQKYKESRLLGSPWSARRCGQSGILSTNLFPHINQVIDQLCLIRSMRVEFSSHVQATMYMHTGAGAIAMPGIGAWLSYGLGTSNPDLPSHVVFAKDRPYGGSQGWGANFLPAYHQGTRVIPGDDPIPFLRPHEATLPLQSAELDLLERMNRRHQRTHPKHLELAARTLSFRTAQRMQDLAPQIFDLADESEATLRLYGLDTPQEDSFAWKCLMARRMAELGVRFIEVVGVGSDIRVNWDAHSDVRRPGKLAPIIDQPVAALISDLAQRGMLDETLIVWCTEFGRTPYSESLDSRGRGHHPDGFTCWLAGGGVKPGYVYGATDELGDQVVENPVQVHDFHATLLHLVGLDHEKLTFHHAGRDFSLTNSAGFTTAENTTGSLTEISATGHVIYDILA